MVFFFFSYSSEEAVKGCKRQTVWQRMISLCLISEVTALPLLNYSVCANKASNCVTCLFFCCFFPPLILSKQKTKKQMKDKQKKKNNVIRGLWMLGTCLFFKFYICHLISVIFVKKKKHHFIYFCFNILWMFHVFYICSTICIVSYC